MRALFYHAASEWSGSARVFTDAARLLGERGYQVTVACRGESAVEQRVASLGLEVEPVDTPALWFAESQRLRTVLNERFVEVVFVHTEREHLVAAMATRLAERGAVVRRTPAGGRLTLGVRGGRLAMRLAASGFLFTTTGELQSAPPVSRALDPAIADIGVDVSRYDAVRPIKLANLGAPEGGGGGGGNGRLIVCLCDRAAKPRAATVLRAVALLAPRHPGLRLAMIGPGSDEDDLRMHAAALGITGIVSHLGERDDQLSVLAAAQLGWVIADQDTAAYGALDLMALRIPVLAARGSVAQRYLSDGITGVLLPPSDAAATAATIASLFAHEEQRLAMGNAGRARVAREFSETAMAEGFERAAAAARDRTRWIR